MPVILVLYVSACAAVLLRLEKYPSVVERADARAYILFGHSFPSLEPLGTLRTYGYPLLTSVYSHIGGGLDPLTCALVGGAVQLMLYGAAVCWLAAQFEGRARLAIAAGLLLNPIILGLVGDALTEGPTLIIAVVLLVFLIKIDRFPDYAFGWSIPGALLSNFALMIRPTNIVLILAWNVAILFALRASTRNHWFAKRALRRFWWTSDLVQANGLARSL
jgi:hypothetical protein